MNEIISFDILLQIKELGSLNTIVDELIKMSKIYDNHCQKKTYITSRRARYRSSFCREAKEEKACRECFTNYIQLNTFKFDMHIQIYVKERKSNAL